MASSAFQDAADCVVKASGVVVVDESGDDGASLQADSNVCPDNCDSFRSTSSSKSPRGPFRGGCCSDRPPSSPTSSILYSMTIHAYGRRKISGTA
jgi:hypothetical protein